jgi:hypothetical protein
MLVEMNGQQLRMAKLMVKHAYAKGLDEGLRVFLVSFEHFGMPEDILDKMKTVAERSKVILEAEAKVMFEEAFDTGCTMGKMMQEQEGKVADA